MSTRTTAWLAYSMLALAVLLGVLGTLLLLLNHRSSSWDPWLTLPLVTFLIVGVVVASYRPHNPIGWMFCVVGLANSLLFFAHEYVIYALVTDPGALPSSVWVAWSQYWITFILWWLLVFSILLFPTGGLPSPRWRPLAWAIAGVFILATVLLCIKAGPLQGVGVRVPNPTGIEAVAGVTERALNILVAILFLIVLAAPASVIVRFRGARGEERQQLKSLAYAACFWIGVAGLENLNRYVLRDPVIDRATTILYGSAVAVVPIAIGIAILRYRLYDIDLLINRTLVYGSLTATLAVVYLVGIVVLQRGFVLLAGEQSTLAVVASTLMIAALFTPVRRRIQSFIDRRFYRRKYDARKTLEGFSARLRDETDLQALNNSLVAVVRETMQPAHVSLWLRSDPVPKGGQSD